jgi:hypothetical protein
MATLDAEIATFERMKPDLERHHMGKWVVIHEEELVGAFDSLNSAASQAVSRFGRGPYLIRQVGTPAPFLPGSVLYRQVPHADR